MVPWAVTSKRKWEDRVRVSRRMWVPAALAVCAGSGLAGLAGASAQDDVPHVRIGLSAPVVEVPSLDAFTSTLAKHLVWEVGGSGSRAERIRLTVIRIDRRRVTGSRQSRLVTVPPKRLPVSESLGWEAWNAVFPDCCFTRTDPPARIRALSGSAYVDEQGLERAIANVAESSAINGVYFEINPAVEVDWGRHVVLIVAASSDYPILVRPLVLVLERR